MARVNDTRQPDKIDAEAMEDYTRMRQHGISLKQIVEMDLKAHEEFCDDVIDGMYNIQYIIVNGDDGTISISDLPSTDKERGDWCYSVPSNSRFTFSLKDLVGHSYIYEAIVSKLGVVRRQRR